MSVLSQTDLDRIAAFLDGHTLAKGLGTATRPCSIAALNLALYGRLTDDIPECMSLVKGRWVIIIQDAMPFAMRNSPEWKRALTAAAGTGRDPELERKRLALVMDWMWGALALAQPVADKYGFGTVWERMCRDRTVSAAADVAARAERMARHIGPDSAAWEDVDTAANAAEGAASAMLAADVAVAASWAAWAETKAMPQIGAWKKLNPAGFLARLVGVT